VEATSGSTVTAVKEATAVTEAPGVQAVTEAPEPLYSERAVPVVKVVLVVRVTPAELRG
jgi:hypothetical protein